MAIKRIGWAFLLAITLSCGLLACDMPKKGNSVDDTLKVVVIRHGEKPKNGDNLSCQGLNRSLQLPAVLQQKFALAQAVYVPKLNMGQTTTHARMMQTVVPYVVANNLSINSQFDAKKDGDKIAESVFSHQGLVLMVWEHSAIHDLVKALGVKHAPDWQDDDFDSIWIISYHHGKASLAIDKEGLSPAKSCPSLN
jgi:hypothetical protein